MRQEEITGTVKHIIYNNNKSNFTVGIMHDSYGKRVPFAGRCIPDIGETITLIGSWTVHPKYGRQFNVIDSKQSIVFTKEGLITYLAKNPAFKGLGEVKAKKVVDTFGEGFGEVLMTDPKAIADLVKVPLEDVEAWREYWEEKHLHRETMIWLVGLGFSPSQATNIISALGGSARKIVEENPYQLIDLVSGFGFKRTDAIALEKLGYSVDHPYRLQAAVFYVMNKATEDGHCWLPREHLKGLAKDLASVDDKLIYQAIDDVLEAGKLQLVPEHQGLALPHMIEAERRVAHFFESAWNPHPGFHGTININELNLNEGQEKAVRNALSYQISLISGGAGSGKSYTIAALCRILKTEGLDVALCAPTGKAAMRLREVSGYDGLTIHRLLKYRPNGQVEYNSENPLPYDVIIVDEFSMVDIHLADLLFNAIDRSKTAVVLVGDHNQLPPVGPGNILRDLIQTKAIPMVVLNQVVRQAGVLKENSMAILEGKVRSTHTKVTNDYSPWYKIDNANKPEDVLRFLHAFYDRFVDQMPFDPLREVQVITPIHKGPLGTIALNKLLQQKLQKKLYNIDVPKVADDQLPRILPHDKVIQTKNNYDLGIMNGMIGYVQEINDDGSMLVLFDDLMKPVLIPKGKIEDIQLAYALTVHKMQGSESPMVIAVTHRSHSFMNDRNMLYTAATRSRESVVIVGDEKGIGYAASRQRVDERRTSLPFLLNNAHRDMRPRDNLGVNQVY